MKKGAKEDAIKKVKEGRTMGEQNVHSISSSNLDPNTIYTQKKESYIRFFDLLFELDINYTLICIFYNLFKVLVFIFT